MYIAMNVCCIECVHNETCSWLAAYHLFDLHVLHYIKYKTSRIYTFIIIFFLQFDVTTLYHELYIAWCNIVSYYRSYLASNFTLNDAWSVWRRRHYEQSTVHSAQYTVHIAVYNVQCTHCTVYNVHFTLYICVLLFLLILLYSFACLNHSIIILISSETLKLIQPKQNRLLKWFNFFLLQI